MSFKATLFVVFLGTVTALVSTSALAIDDYCTPKLESYLKNAQETVDSKYMPTDQKDIAQQVLDKVKASRNETNDCILVDELF